MNLINLSKKIINILLLIIFFVIFSFFTWKLEEINIILSNKYIY